MQSFVEKFQISTPKWVLSPQARARIMKDSHPTSNAKKNIKNTFFSTNFPAITTSSDKIVLGTNVFTQKKNLDFIKYRLNLQNKYDKEQNKKRENTQYFKGFELSLRNSLSENEKFAFKNRTTSSKFKFFEEFKEKMTTDDIEFEKKIEYNEKIYEENMKQKKNVIETLQVFEDDPTFSNSLALYKFEYYQKKGFKNNEFNLAAENNEFSMNEFSVSRQMKNFNSEAEIFRNKISSFINKREKIDHLNKISQRVEKKSIEKKITISPLSPKKESSRKIKRKYMKQTSNKNFFFWLDLNKVQRILLKMKNFFSKLIQLKLKLHEVSFFSKKLEN